MGPETLDDIPRLPADEGVPKDPGLVVRDQTFKEIATSGTELAGVDVSKLSLEGRRRFEENRELALQAEEKTRLESIEPLIADVARNPDVPLGVKSSVIEQIEGATRLGAHPESLAVEELITQETEILESTIEQETAARVSEQLADNHDLQQQIFDLQESLRLATDPSIPYLETGFEFITGPVLGFLHSDGININNMIAESLGIVDPGFDISAKDSIKAANRLVAEMTVEEKKQVVKRLGDYAHRNKGIFLDNGWTVDSLNHVIGVLFGSRMEANIAANQNGLAQLLGVLTSGTAARAAQLVKVSASANKAQRAAKKASEISSPNGIEEAPLGATANDVTRPADRTGFTGPSETAADSAPPTQGVSATITATDDTLRVIQSGGLPNQPVPVFKIDLTKELAPNTVVPPQSPAATVARTAPVLGREIIRNAVKSPDAAARLGTNQNEIVDDYLLWITPDQPVRRQPNLIDYSVEGRAVGDDADAIFHDFKGTTPEDISPEATNRSLVNQTEVTRATVDLSQKLRDVEGIAIKKVRVNGESDQGIVADVIVSKTSGVGFDSVDEVEEFISRNIDDADLNDFVPLGYDPKTDTYRAGITDAPEYLAQVNFRRLRSAIAQPEDVFKKKKNGGDKFSLTPRLRNSFDTTIGYIERIARGVTRITNNTGNISSNLRKDLEPMYKLSADDQHAAWSTLRREAAEGRVYTREQLMTKLTSPQREGYYAVRTFYDRVHGIRNDLFREVSGRAGFRLLRIPNQPNAFVKPLVNTEEVKTAWLLDEGRIVGREYLDNLGIELDYFRSQLRRMNEDGSESTDFVVSTKDTARLLPLPTDVLKYRPEYLGQNIETKFVLYKPGTVKHNGGKEDTFGQVVAVTDDALEAQRFADKHDLRVRIAKENVDQDGGTLGSEVQNLGELGLLNHSYARTDLHKLHTSVKQSQKTPEELIDDTIFATSRTVGNNETINYMINKLMATYGDRLKIRQFAWGEPIQAPSTDAATKQLTLQANIMRRKIEQIAGFTNSNINRRMRESSLLLAEEAARLAINHGDKGVRANAYKAVAKVTQNFARDWVSDINRINFTRHIALSPLRQQMQNAGMAFIYGGVKHGSEYYGSLRGSADTMAVAAMKMAGDNEKGINQAAKIWAGVTGGKPDEIKQIYSDVVESGILNISDHQFLESVFRGSASLRSHAGNTAEAGPRAFAPGAAVGRAVKAGVEASTDIGFGSSEQFNKLAAFLVMRNRAVKEGESIDARKIGEDAGIISGNMGAANRLAFQNGNLKILTQFQGHTIRMMQFMVSDVPGLDAATKGRMLLWNTLAYGTRGLGLGDAAVTGYHKYLKGIAEDEDIGDEPFPVEILTDGFMSILYNNLLETVLDVENSDVNIGGTASPLAGVLGDLGYVIPVDGGGRPTNLASTGVKLTFDLLARRPVQLGEYIGVSDSLISTGVNWLDKSYKIIKAEGFNNSEKGQALFTETLKVIPSFNRVAQARMAYATGVHADSYGNPLIAAETAEVVSLALFGIQPDRVDKYFKLRRDWGTNPRFPAGNDREWRQTGKDLADRVITTLRVLNNGDISQEDYEDKLHGLSSLIKTTYGGSDYAMDIIWSAALTKMQNTRTDGTTAFDKLAESLLTDAELAAEVGFETINRRLKEVEGRGGDILRREAARVQELSGL